jgi:LmbE family N-acetylglucosaminyl deacetylase
LSPRRDSLRPLVISPHADDEVLGCVSWLDQHATVFYCGIDEFHVVSREERLREVEAVAALLGFEWRVGDFVVNRYSERFADLVTALETVVNDVRPDVLLIPAPSYNQDHQAVHRASLVATRHHDRNFFVRRVLVYEGPDNYLAETWPFMPNYFRAVDTDRKVAANELHRSQLRGHRAPDLLRLMAAHRGRQAGLDSAEAFMATRWVDEGV